MKNAEYFLSILLSASLLFAPLTLEGCSKPTSGSPAPASSGQQAATTSAQQSQQVPATTQANPTPDELYQLVAPIALFPDNLVALVLAASTYPDQVTAANTWLGQNANLKGDALNNAVDAQSWDNSVKGLTQFPDVVTQMATNLSWTAALGDAYVNTPQDVMNAVQVMRKKAEAVGNLKTTPQQTVTDDPYGAVDIAPADPAVVYVPAYDPWAVYGYPIGVWPGWYEYPGIWFGGPYLSFGLGFGIGWYGGFGWGWGHWGFDWRNHYAVFDHERFYSRSRTFYNRDAFYRGGVRGGGVFNRPGTGARPYEGSRPEARGFSESHSESGMRSDAFSHYDHGGESRGYSSRGESSFHGGGFSGGRGGFGGGGHGGGGRR